MSELADVMVGAAARESSEDVCGSAAVPPFCVLGLGKLGGKEITFGSDLDCVVVGGEDSPGDRHLLEKIAQGFLARMNRWRLYRVDLRLRPEGRNAPLSSPLSTYRQYLEDRAALWERQALLKARFVWGDPLLGAQALQLFRQHAVMRPLPERWTEELRAMRDRVRVERGEGRRGRRDLKVGEGGLVDLEFGLQALQLRYGRQREELLSSNSFEALEGAERWGEIASLNLHDARRRLTYLRTLETVIRLNEEAAASTLPDEPALLKAIAAATGSATAEDLIQTIDRVCHENVAFFRATLDLVQQ
jgi:glutamate-ammonia-ligase adenylyltransferase